jgi:hypothetical protein
MAKDGVTCRIDRHGAAMDDKRMAVLEDTHLTNRETDRRGEIGPPGDQRHEEEKTEQVDCHLGTVGTIAAGHEGPLAS